MNPSLAKSSTSKTNDKNEEILSILKSLRTEQLNANKKLEAYGHRLDQIENYEYCDDDGQYDEMYQEQGSEFGCEDTRSVSDVTAGVKRKSDDNNNAAVASSSYFDSPSKKFRMVETCDQDVVCFSKQCK